MTPAAASGTRTPVPQINRLGLDCCNVTLQIIKLLSPLQIWCLIDPSTLNQPPAPTLILYRCHHFPSQANSPAPRNWRLWGSNSVTVRPKTYQTIHSEHTLHKRFWLTGITLINLQLSYINTYINIQVLLKMSTVTSPPHVRALCMCFTIHSDVCERHRGGETSQRWRIWKGSVKPRE